MNWLHLDPLGKAREQELDPLRTLDIRPHLVFGISSLMELLPLVHRAEQSFSSLG